MKSILHFSKLAIWGSSWGRGFRFHWSRQHGLFLPAGGQAVVPLAGNVAPAGGISGAPLALSMGGAGDGAQVLLPLFPQPAEPGAEGPGPEGPGAVGPKYRTYLYCNMIYLKYRIIYTFIYYNITCVNMI